MTRDDHIRKDVIMQMMCNLEIDKPRVESEFGIDFEDYFFDDLRKLGPFIDQGLVENDRTAVRVTGSGLLIIRNVAMCFDAYLEKMMREKPVFSKTV